MADIEMSTSAMAVFRSRFIVIDSCLGSCTPGFAPARGRLRHALTLAERFRQYFADIQRQHARPQRFSGCGLDCAGGSTRKSAQVAQRSPRGWRRGPDHLHRGSSAHRLLAGRTFGDVASSCRPHVHPVDRRGVRRRPPDPNLRQTYPHGRDGSSCHPEFCTNSGRSLRASWSRWCSKRR